MRTAFAALAALAMVVSCGGREAAPTPIPDPTIAPAPASVPTIALTPAPAPTIASTPTQAPTVTPAPTQPPTPAPTQTPTPTPEPPPGPTEEQRAVRAGAIASEWIANNAEIVARLVAEVVLASSDVEDLVPVLLRANLGGLLEAAVADELGNSLGVEVDSLAYHGDAVFSVTLMVSGTVAVGLGPVEAVDVAAPIVVMVDLDSEQATAWEADVERAEVTVR